jgi:hypothetical protein
VSAYSFTAWDCNFIVVLLFYFFFRCSSRTRSQGCTPSVSKSSSKEGDVSLINLVTWRIWPNRVRDRRWEDADGPGFHGKSTHAACAASGFPGMLIPGMHDCLWTCWSDCMHTPICPNILSFWFRWWIKSRKKKSWPGKIWLDGFTDVWTLFVSMCALWKWVYSCSMKPLKRLSGLSVPSSLLRKRSRISKCSYHGTGKDMSFLMIKWCQLYF